MSKELSNKVLTIDSREVAEMVETRHSDLLRKVEGNNSTVGIIQKIKDNQLNISDFFIKSSYKDARGKIRKSYLVTKKGLRIIIDSCRTKTKPKLMDIYNNMKDDSGEKKEILITTNRPEYEFIDAIINSLKPFGITDFKTQYFCCGKYRIDLYLPELNIAIEFDENGHKNYTYEKHERRQKEIEEELNCKFIRVNSNNNLFFNIGLVIKEIFN